MSFNCPHRECDPYDSCVLTEITRPKRPKRYSATSDAAAGPRPNRKFQIIEHLSQCSTGATRQELAHGMGLEEKHVTKAVRDLLDNGTLYTHGIRPTKDGYPAEILFLKEQE